MKPLSEKDSAVLKLIREELDHGIVPSVREIGARLGIKSTSTVHRSLKSLTEKGYIQRDHRLGRSIRLPNSRVTHVPILGRVAAGNPILAEEQPVEDYIPVGNVGDAAGLFALRIRGDSMINAGILDGDVIVARRSSTASNGEIVVALIDDSATVKRFYKENGGYRLQPENDSMSPIYTDHLMILGKVIALHREY